MAQNPSKLAAAGSMVAKSASMNSGFQQKGDNNLRKLDTAPITSVEEFCPEGGHLGGFLDDVLQVNSQNTSKLPENEESDS